MAKTNASYFIVWRPMAVADLDNIIDYIAQDNPNTAEEFAQKLRQKTLKLAQHPKLSRTGRPSIPDFIRELVVHPNYMVFYRVMDENRIIEILRVKHYAQKIPLTPCAIDKKCS